MKTKAQVTDETPAKKRQKKKKKFDLTFSCAISSEKRKEEKINSTEADLYKRSTMWSIKGKSGKSWDLGHIKRQNFF